MTTLDMPRSYRARAFVVGQAVRIFDTFASMLRERRQRRKLRRLADAEQWILDDIGIGRGDLDWALHLPMHVSASREIEKLRDRARHYR